MADAGLEVIFSFLLAKSQVSVSTLGTGPKVLNTFARKLCMAFGRQQNNNPNLFGDMLHHPLLIQKIEAHAHYVLQTCTVINRTKVVLLAGTPKRSE
jgi:hypothetical protein